MLFFQKHSKDQTEAQKWKNDMDLLFISDAVILTNFLYLQELILRKEKKKRRLFWLFIQALLAFSLWIYNGSDRLNSTECWAWIIRNVLSHGQKCISRVLCRAIKVYASNWFFVLDEFLVHFNKNKSNTSHTDTRKSY